MDFKNILNQIEQADPEVYEKLSPRRHILKSFGSKVAVAALPIAVGSLFKKAYGKNTDAVTDILNFALQLEYLEYNFYEKALNDSTLPITADDLGGLDKIRQHELLHVEYLTATVTAMGGTPYTPPTNYSGDYYTPASFNFTGVIPNIFTDYDTFLSMAQVFEDTGVRAYKGQAVNLQGTDALGDALRIHSLEARHAAHIRRIRRKADLFKATGYITGTSTTGTALYVASSPDLKPWITGATPPSNLVAAQNNYAGDDITTQLNVPITSLPGASGNVSQNAATESFDEPLSKDEVTPLISGFFL